jgi:hypothetical protein
LNIEQFCERNYKTIKKYFFKGKIKASSGIIGKPLMSGISWSWFSEFETREVLERY